MLNQYYSLHDQNSKINNLMTKKLLDQINYPSDLRQLKRSQLEQVSNELRSEVIDVVSETGGHLGAGLGVVELTTAIHYVFNSESNYSPEIEHSN